jgi:hypothetical protein
VRGFLDRVLAARQAEQMAGTELAEPIEKRLPVNPPTPRERMSLRERIERDVKRAKAALVKRGLLSPEELDS